MERNDFSVKIGECFRQSGENCLRREQTAGTARHTERAIHRSGGYEPIVPHYFDTNCSSVPSVDGWSGRELFEFEHSLSIGKAVRVK
jgi:hypothetical protein